MRVVVFYICLSFLLLSGGNYLYADTHHSPASFCFNQNLEKKQQIKHRNSNHHTVATADADIDLDEEFHASDEHKDNGANKLLAGRQSFLTSWYLTFSNQIIFKDYSKKIKIFTPFSVHSNPIYLRIGVFRI